MCKIIYNLFNCGDEDLLKPMIMHVSDIIQALMKNAYREDARDQPYSIDLSLLTITIILYQAKDKKLCLKYYQPIAKELQNTFNILSYHKHALQSGLLSCLQGIVTALDKDITSDQAK